MVTKSFDYLLTQFNSSNTLLRKICKNTYVFLRRSRDKFSGLVAGAMLLLTNAVKFHIIIGHICLLFGALS